MALGNNIMQPVAYTDALTGMSMNISPAMQGGYMQAYNQYATAKQQDLMRRRQELDDTLKQNNATTNANYDNNARQAYVDYMRKQKALPSQLQALGVRGGATESGLLNLYNNYGTSHAANEQQRAADLTKNQQARDDAYNAYYADWKNDLDNQWQIAVNNQMNEYNNEITRFSSSVAQYPTTEKGYKKYQEWINNLAASADPLKDIKIALVRQQMASQFATGKPSGGGGGGSSKGSSKGSGKGSGGGGGNGGGGNAYSAMDAYYKANAEKMKNYTNTRTTTVSGKSSGNKNSNSGLNRTQNNSYWK